MRRRGHSPEDEEDLTQGFFARLLEKEYVRRADPARGKFRSFLLAALNHFLVNEWARSMRQKRGGGCGLVPWDRESAEHRYRVEPVDQMTPEKVFDKQWAITLLERVLSRLREEQVAAGRERLFQEVKACLWGDKATAGYAELAKERLILIRDYGLDRVESVRRLASALAPYPAHGATVFKQHGANGPQRHDDTDTPAVPCWR